MDMLSCLPVKLYFVNSCEVTSFTVNDHIRSPYATLQRVLMSRGVESFSAAWSDEYNNFFPLKSDHSFAEAVHARQHPHQPLRIFVKETRLSQNGGNFRPRGYSGNFARQGMLRDGGPSPMGPWNSPKKERMPDVGPQSRKMFQDGQLQQQQRHQQEQPRLSFQQPGRREMRDVPRMPHPTAVAHPSRNQSRSPVMPKDPTLAELVDKVRHNLDMVASMHTSQTKSDDGVPQQLGIEMKKERLVSIVPVPESLAVADCVSDRIMADLMDACAADEEPHVLLLSEAAPERAESIWSEGDEFMVVTPGSDSCVHFSMEDFEAAISELDSEDNFEIVDCPDGDWDSDIENVEWKETVIQ